VNVVQQQDALATRLASIRLMARRATSLSLMRVQSSATKSALQVISPWAARYCSTDFLAQQKTWTWFVSIFQMITKHQNVLPSRFTRPLGCLFRSETNAALLVVVLVAAQPKRG
jgi:hypothetical protein